MKEMLSATRIAPTESANAEGAAAGAFTRDDRRNPSTQRLTFGGARFGWSHDQSC
jgi:hypothetical protein